MAEEQSLGTLYAGQFGPISLAAGSPLNALGSESVQIYDSDGLTAASLYTDRTKATGGSNPFTTNAYGIVQYWAAPGYYVASFSVGGTPTTMICEVKPDYADSAWNVVIDTASAIALSGDCRLANATSAAITETWPAPTLGARIKTVKTDASANAVSVTTPSGNIQGPGLTAGATQTLAAAGDFYEAFADGTNWHVTAQTGGGGGGAVASGKEVAITTANTWQTIATYTPTATALFTVQALFDVASGTPTGGVQVTYANANGAVVMALTPVGTSLAVGPDSSLSALIAAVAGTAINVQVQTSVTAGLTASAYIGAM